MNKTTKKKNPMKRCHICGERAVQVTLKDEVVGLILVQNIPDYHCEACGETYYTLETQKAIDEIRAHPERYAEEKFIFAAALA